MLFGWKRKYLSKGEKITLFKSTLSNPTFVFIPPPSVAKRTKRMETLQKILVGKFGKTRKLQLVNWAMVKQHFVQGGLQEKSLQRISLENGCGDT